MEQQTLKFSIDSILHDQNSSDCSPPTTPSPPSSAGAASSLRNTIPYPLLVQLALQSYPYYSYSPYATPGATLNYFPSPAASSLCKYVSTTGTTENQDTVTSDSDEELERGTRTGHDEEDHSRSPKALSPRNSKLFKKKKRTAFSSGQLQEMETKFTQQKYLTKLDRCSLAKSLGLTEKHVKTWYQNRRTKWKRDTSNQDWSKQREQAATAMYAQYLQTKSLKMNHEQLQQCSVF